MINLKRPRAYCVFQFDVPEMQLVDISHLLKTQFGARCELICNGQAMVHIPTSVAVRDGRESENLEDSEAICTQFEFLSNLRDPNWLRKAMDTRHNKKYLADFWLSPVNVFVPSRAYHLAVQFRGCPNQMEMAEKSQWVMMNAWAGQRSLQLRFQFTKPNVEIGVQRVLEHCALWHTRCNTVTWPDGGFSVGKYETQLVKDGFVARMEQKSDISDGNIFPWLDLYCSLRLDLPENLWPSRVYWGKQ